MAAVFLMDRPYDTGILRFVPVRYFRGAVGRAVVDDDDFHILSAGQKAFDAVLHVGFRVIAGDREGDHLHTQTVLFSQGSGHRGSARVRRPHPCCSIYIRQDDHQKSLNVQI
ncbi:hypothetical protein SDC9_138989 [bioreactor metagenome]|uniref:Uncharacterized protein n=1 Tax=bioreactor metagenome TaxID=1076179 RepID=A0A645DRF7_9ZZZZ